MCETRDSDSRGSNLRRLVLAEISDPDDTSIIDAFVRALLGNDESPSPTIGAD